MNRKKKFRKVVNHNVLYLIMVFVTLISLTIWIINSLVNPNWWSGFWMGITLLVTIYWILTYFWEREVYYEEI